MYPANTPFMLAMELVCGAAGALALRWQYPGRGTGVVAAVVVGMLGGFLFTLLASHIPGVGRFVGHAENAADAAMRGIGGITPAIMIGVGISGLLGGVILSVIVLLLRNLTDAGRWQA